MSKKIVLNMDCLTTTRKSKGGGGEKPPRNTTLKPNKIKQALINRIKTYHSELLNKDRIESEATAKKMNIVEQPKSEFDESVELFNQMAKEKEKKEERRKLRFSTNITSGTNQQAITQSMPQSSPVITQPQELPSPAYLEEARTRKKRPMLNVETKHNHTIKITASDHVPYGILKGGSKPTYRQFKQPPPIQIQETVIHTPVIHTPVIHTPVIHTPVIHTPVIHTQVAQPINAEEPTQEIKINTEIQPPDATFYEERSKKFDEFKKRFHQKLEEKASQIDAAGSTPSNYEAISSGTRRIRKKVKKHRTLGKHKGKISVLVKNYETRRKIERECAILKEKPIGVVKDFLRERGFIKMGSSAPDHILRQMYESCFLSGDVNNLNGENLIHNYLKDPSNT
jgi:hypothetical protein